MEDLPTADILCNFALFVISFPLICDGLSICSILMEAAGGISGFVYGHACFALLKQCLQSESLGRHA